MSLSLEKITQILEKAKISSSQEEEILIAAKDVITAPKANKEESTPEELYTSDKEQACEKEIEDEEGISGDHHANESCVEQWFQVSVRLDQCCFRFYFDLHLESLISHTFEYIRLHF